MHQNRQTSVGGQQRFAGAAASGSGFGDILDNELNKPALSRGRSTNMLSDAGSKYGVDDDEMSHYMGQSALGGAETGSNAGGYA